MLYLDLTSYRTLAAALVLYLDLTSYRTIAVALLLYLDITSYRTLALTLVLYLDLRSYRSSCLNSSTALGPALSCRDLIYPHETACSEMYAFCFFVSM